VDFRVAVNKSIVEWSGRRGMGWTVWSCWLSENCFVVGVGSSVPRVCQWCCIIGEERWHRACGGSDLIISVVWVMVGIILADGLDVFSGLSGEIMIHGSVGQGRVGD